MKIEKFDYLIIGAGVIGITIALELKRRYPRSKIAIIEKERETGFHSSGRNSGVIHAGFYYTADSLKARFTRDGNRELTAYVKKKGLPINECGKLVVARNESELSGIETLLKRGAINGVELKELSAAEAARIEPRVKTCRRAIFSPATSSVDPGDVLQALTADLIVAGVELKTDTAYKSVTGNTLLTTRGQLSGDYIINTAGLYADRIARDFGFSKNYTILPFKGLYLYGDPSAPPLNCHIYPVPDLRNPFLGVHFTTTVTGGYKIGPTAIPAFWRQQYRGWDAFSPGELAEILFQQTSLFFRAGFDFRKLALQEIKKYSRGRLVKHAGELLEQVNIKDFQKWGRPGIRAQLLDLKKRSLVMDFLLEGDASSFHVLNAVSPAFTCSIPFSRYVCDEIEKARN